jgi:serine protease
MSPRYAVTALALALAVLLVPTAAGAAGTATSFAPLTRSIAKSQLGKHAAADLRRGARRARVQYRREHYCVSLRTLGHVIERAARLATGARVARSARKLQRTVFLRRTARNGRCGLVPRFRITRSVRPDTKRLPSLADGHPRIVARLASGHGTVTDFVQDELVVEGARATAARLAARWHGKLLDTTGDAGKGGGETHLIRIAASRAPTDDLAADLVAADPTAHGRFKVSSAAGLGLLAVAADAAAHGLKVAPDVLTTGAGVLDRSTAEAPVDATTPSSWTGDAYDWWYTSTLGTGDAWRALAMAGRTSNRVKLAVLDNGFSTKGLPDLSPASTGADDVPSAVLCSGGGKCPWHGTEVASAAAGIVDNGLGAAGTGGQVADVLMIRNGRTMFESIDAIYEAFEAGARIINISSGMEFDATVSVFALPYEDATQTAFEHGALVVASAGNDGRDVDAEDCFVVCWEEEWIAPCENDPVICVGGIDASGGRNAKSNFGRERCGNAQDCDVDIFAPYSVWVGPSGDNPLPHRPNGTSFSSPYVAGVLAQIMAAAPKLGLADVRQALLESTDRVADETVSRIVNAGAAVKRTAGAIAPRVEITQADAKVLYGGFNTTTLKATVSSVDPCKCTIEWSSDKDGPMGTGASIDWTYATAGVRTITVQATDANGKTGFDQVDVNATNERPIPRITKPADGTHVYSGQPFKVEGSAADVNQLAGLSCSGLWWVATGNVGLGGCSVTMTLLGDGNSESIGVWATDPDGAQAYTSVTVIVDKPPPHSPPLVTILSPSEGDLLAPNDAVTLEGTATDPDAGALTGTWSVKVGGTTKLIGHGNTLQWKPANDVGPGCGSVDATLVFSATDSDGSASDQIGVQVDYPVC